MNANEYCGYRPGRERPRVVNAMVVVLSLLAGTAAINWLGTRAVWNPYLGVQTKKLARMRELAPQIRTLFVGTSHIYNGVSAREFDKIVEEDCHIESFSFNAAVPDLRGPELRAYLAAMARIPHLKPERVFIEPVVNPTPNTQHLLAVRTRYHFSWASVAEGILVRLEGNVPYSRKVASIAAQTAAAALHQLNLGVLADVALPSCPRCDTLALNKGPREEQRAKPFDRGDADEMFESVTGQSMVNSGSWHRDAGGVRPTDLSGLRAPLRTLSSAEQQYLGRTFSQIRELGAEPIALQPPLTVELGDRRAINHAIQGQFPNVGLFSYLWAERMPESSSLRRLFDTDGAWFDNTHLNGAGARAFTQILASDFCVSMTRTARSR